MPDALMPAALRQPDGLRKRVLDAIVASIAAGDRSPRNLVLAQAAFCAETTVTEALRRLRKARFLIIHYDWVDRRQVRTFYLPGEGVEDTGTVARPSIRRAILRHRVEASRLPASLGCQYLLGEPRDREFCGQPRQGHSPYCPDHHARCYVPAPPLDKLL
ncbi:hypothetical protein [Nitrospirillum viridazoti]|uniref:Uncharacterized protein n=1 Tax=Nitrospirillum viridazoti CBAmc TaxID=1441467 RepID=A0A248JS02_9PROT|nr:hypothetical protein [Nitrospirillum amazonense]ASG21389.1 hypothetical protein Y958_11540 [Nitrospirillum amazonense CBAmc]TWB33066.1 hypothetical protein FBZ91_115128 [Nitrospirillum amazonense]